MCVGEPEENVSDARRVKHSMRFTLIELLVVVAILGILMSLLMPALSKAKKSAQAISCMNNLKQVGVAREIYSGEYDGYFVGGGAQWYRHAFLGQYLGNSNQWGVDIDCKVLFCPSAGGLAVTNFSGTSYDTGYGVHVWLNGSFGSSCAIKLSKIKSAPDKMATFVDGMSNRWYVPSDQFIRYYDDADSWINEWGAEDGSRWCYSIRHNRGAGNVKGTTNVLFLDSHVESFSDLAIAYYNDQLTHKY